MRISWITIEAPIEELDKIARTIAQSDMGKSMGDAIGTALIEVFFGNIKEDAEEDIEDKEGVVGGGGKTTPPPPPLCQECGGPVDENGVSRARGV